MRAVFTTRPSKSAEILMQMRDHRIYMSLLTYIAAFLAREHKFLRCAPKTGAARCAAPLQHAQFHALIR